MTEATVLRRPDAMTADSTLAERLGAAVAAIRVGTFDGLATAKLQLCVLDFLACAFEASALPWARQAAALAAPGSGPCAIVGTPVCGAAADAAFANSVAGHGLVREDMHTGSVSHLGVAVLPALLALAQGGRIDGRSFATAAIIGYEVGARFGRALVTPEFARAFRPTGFTGPLASAAACSRLLRSDAAQTASALSLAANMTGGLNQWPATGADDMYFHTGAATRNGLVAARLASLGTWGSPAALDGAAGLLPSYRPDHEAPDIALFDGEPEIMSVFFKPVPVCNFAQTPCLAALALAPRLRNAEAIRAIDVAVTRAAQAYPGCDHAGPFARVLQAKMSIQYAVAAAILGGKVDEESYTDLDNPALLALAGKIRIRTDDALTAAFPKKQGARVTVTFTDGQVFHEELEDVTAADETLVRSRFRQAATAAVGAAQATEIETALDGLASLDDVGAIMRLTTTRN
jgi:2-methylcitrate dehydratase PrpD